MTCMWCCEAKVMSATEPERKEEIEKIFQCAFGSLESDEPHFLSSYLSLVLSKAAFHLRFAFGAKPSGTELPPVSYENVQKAREILVGCHKMLASFGVKKDMLIDARRLEYDSVEAELCRLEGKEEEARSRFSVLAQATGSNLAAIAEHRLGVMSSQP